MRVLGERGGPAEEMSMCCLFPDFIQVDSLQDSFRDVIHIHRRKSIVRYLEVIKVAKQGFPGNNRRLAPAMYKRIVGLRPLAVFWQQ